MKDIIIQVLKGYSTDSEDKPNTSIDFDRIESLADDLIIALEKDLSNQSEEILKLIPTNWLDPLLTGKDRVLGKHPYTGDDIQNLLSAIKERQAKWMQDKLYRSKKECWACFKKLPKGHKSGLCSDCQIRG